MDEKGFQFNDCKKVKSKNVDLFIKSKQSFGSKGTDGFELFTTGVLKKRKNKWVLEYENEYSGRSKMELLGNGGVNITSVGEICYNLKLDKNKYTKFSCSTKDTFSYFSVKTEDIFFDINETGGNINLKYLLEIDGTSNVLQTTLNILIK